MKFYTQGTDVLQPHDVQKLNTLNYTPCFIEKQTLWFFIISLPNCGQFL